jgi:hypothetical protein
MTEVPIGDAPVLLLGAGSSVEAGVPASADMTRAIVELVGSTRQRELASALNFAVGAMIAHDTARGGNPFAGVDVERLFAAVQMLGNRDALEVTPFVASWAPALELLGPERHVPTSFARNFSRALKSDFPSDLDRVFSEAVLAVLPSNNNDGEIYRELERVMVARLRDLTAIDPGQVDYLAPLLHASKGPLRVATLNYDRSLEEVALRAGVSVDRGIEAWSGAYDWRWNEDADLQLLKLHGSIDWQLEDGRGAGGLRQTQVTVGARRSYVKNPAEVPDGSTTWFRSPPAVVFGQRGKLRADGPFLAMLRAFEQFLAGADHLIVVGYSFRDEHINSAIGRWVNTVAWPSVTIVDPSFDVESSFNMDPRAFLTQLRRSMEVREQQEHQHGWNQPGLSWKNGFRVVNEKASLGLFRLFGPGPALAPPQFGYDESA